MPITETSELGVTGDPGALARGVGLLNVKSIKCLCWQVTGTSQKRRGDQAHRKFHIPFRLKLSKDKKIPLP